MNRRVVRWLAAIAIVSMFVARVAANIVENSATLDEPEYITSGYSYVATGELRLETWHPPLSFLLAGLAVRARFDLPFEPDPTWWARAKPRELARGFLYKEGRDAPAILHTARLPFLVLGVLTVLLVGAWAAQLWGERAGWLALVLAAFDPNLIAHAGLATPDIGLTFFTLATMYATWRYLRAPTLRRWLAICAGALLALATKHVAFLLAPLIGIALVEAVVTGDAARRRTLFRTAGVTLGAVLGVGLVVALLGVPVADKLVDGVRAQFRHLDLRPNAYLHGELGTGWLYYYLVVLALKVPLGTLVLAGTSAIRWRAGVPITRPVALVVVVPIAAIVVLVSVTGIDLGVRLILPALPFAIVLAARAATLPGRWRWLAAGALAATVVGSTLATRRELSYFNAAAVGGGDQWLSDSNLDWGQDLDRLAAYLRDTNAPPVYLAYFGGGSPTHAKIRHASLPTRSAFPYNADLIDDLDEADAPCRADRQLLAISRFRQQGLGETPPTLYDWLARLEPIAEIGDTIRVYDITQDAESHVRVANLYDMATPVGLCESKRALRLDMHVQLHPKL